jgi:NAD(P)-dependent dehydrogenase (short-subunit alcohol dehydrogenase family)
VDALTKAGATVHTFDLPEQDITDADSVTKFLCTITPPDILVNNAGVDSRPTMTDYGTMTRAMADVNLLGTDRMCDVIGTWMHRGGSIINIASLYGLVSPDLRYYDHREDGWVKDPMYGATKAGVISLTRYYAAKFGRDGVRVNALAPGGVVAEGDGLTAQDPEFVAKYTARIPMGRMCRPADLAGPLVFLASDASSFVTGQTIALDGGYLCW